MKELDKGNECWWCARDARSKRNVLQNLEELGRVARGWGIDYGAHVLLGSEG